MKRFCISVRELVEFTERSGSIMPGSGPVGLKRAQEGVVVHGRVQRERKDLYKSVGLVYESEVSLKVRHVYDEFEYVIDGRADGLINDDTGDVLKIILEEIKTTNIPLTDINPPAEHIAQAKCYAYMACVLRNANEAVIKLLYINEDEERVFEENASKDDLLAFFEGIIRKYHAFAALQARNEGQRLESAKRLEFPFGSYRASQRELAVSVYGAIKRRKKLFVQAPTGTGKTISTLFPAVKAMGEGLVNKVFVLTAKGITREVTENAFLMMHERGLQVRFLTMIAKDKICFTGTLDCDAEYCEYARGHYDRINEAVLDIVENENCINRAKIERYARKYMVCPHEYSLDVSLFCEIIVCDFNHVYNPTARIKRFFGEIGSKTSLSAVLLHDEAHNLFERARDMFSSQLCVQDFSELLKIFPRQYKRRRIYNYTSDLVVYLDKISGTSHTETVPTDFCELLSDFKLQIEDWFNENAKLKQKRKSLFGEILTEVYFKVSDFLRTRVFFDERYVVYYEDKLCKLLCLDPSYLLAQAQAQVTSSVFFSATLSPLAYYRETLGGSVEDLCLALPSPFSPSQTELFINPYISTKYKERAASYKPIADCIRDFVAQRIGNYLVFFSSYEYMNNCLDVYEGDERIIVQEQSMNEEERVEFLQDFDLASTQERSLVGFAVLGGSFSEGIDLTGERLIGVVIVGVGLPAVTYERNLLCSYYDNAKKPGFDFAYVYPGFNKVMQAIGRLIRTENDTGRVLLIDKRYAENQYSTLLRRSICADFVGLHPTNALTRTL